MEEPAEGTSSKRAMPAAVDAALGAAAMATSVAVSVTRHFARRPPPPRARVMHPPLLAKRLHPPVFEALADRGNEARTSTGLATSTG